MIVTIEYFFADESTEPLTGQGASEAIQGFPWEQQIDESASRGVSPEVRFVRRAREAQSPDDIEAYASVMKNENNTWLIVAGARKAGRLFGFIPTTRKTDIILDELPWQDVSDFFDHFYQDGTIDLFAWMKERDT